VYVKSDDGIGIGIGRFVLHDELVAGISNTRDGRREEGGV
jgi:hypothetical protein